MKKLLIKIYKDKYLVYKSIYFYNFNLKIQLILIFIYNKKKKKLKSAILL